MSRGRLPDHDRVTVHLHVDPDTARDPSLLARHFRRTSLPMSEWAGCTVFLSPELERDGQPIFLDERVRAFYRDDWRAFIDELGLPEDFRDTALRLCEPRLG